MKRLEHIILKELLGVVTRLASKRYSWDNSIRGLVFEDSSCGPDDSRSAIEFNAYVESVMADFQNFVIGRFYVLAESLLKCEIYPHSISEGTLTDIKGIFNDATTEIANIILDMPVEDMTYFNCDIDNLNDFNDGGTAKLGCKSFFDSSLHSTVVSIFKEALDIINKVNLDKGIVHDISVPVGVSPIEPDISIVPTVAPSTVPIVSVSAVASDIVEEASKPIPTIEFEALNKFQTNLVEFGKAAEQEDADLIAKHFIIDENLPIKKEHLPDLMHILKSIATDIDIADAEANLASPTKFTFEKITSLKSFTLTEVDDNGNMLSFEQSPQQIVMRAGRYTFRPMPDPKKHNV